MFRIRNDVLVFCAVPGCASNWRLARRPSTLTCRFPRRRRLHRNLHPLGCWRYSHRRFRCLRCRWIRNDDGVRFYFCHFFYSCLSGCCCLQRPIVARIHIDSVCPKVIEVTRCLLCVRQNWRIVSLTYWKKAMISVSKGNWNYSLLTCWECDGSKLK